MKGQEFLGFLLAMESRRNCPGDGAGRFNGRWTPVLEWDRCTPPLPEEKEKLLKH